MRKNSHLLSFFYFLAFLSLILCLLPLGSASINLGVKRSAQIQVIPQNTVDNVPIHVWNHVENGENLHVRITSIQLTKKSDGTKIISGSYGDTELSGGGLEVKIFPPPENFPIKWGKVYEANFYLPNMNDTFTESRTTPEVPEEYRDWVDVMTYSGGIPEGENLPHAGMYRWIPAKEVHIQIKASDNAELGEYELRVGFVGQNVEWSPGGGTGITAAMGNETHPTIQVVGPPPPPPPTPPLPVWATITLIAVVAGLVVVLGWAIKKGKVKI